VSNVDSTDCRARDLADDVAFIVSEDVRDVDAYERAGLD
jgi:hypothetical protein